jgi:hypothetical protein
VLTFKLHAILFELLSRYNPHGTFISQGPERFHALAEKWCKMTNLTGGAKCENLTLHNRKVFNYVNWGSTDFVKEDQDAAAKLVMKLMNESYIAHYWNDHSKKYPAHLKSFDQAISQLAHMHCPATAFAAGDSLWGFSQPSVPRVSKRRR